MDCVEVDRMSTSYRRLVVLLDGTWQELKNRTNVALLNENIDVGKSGDGVEQIVKYFQGVGTAMCDKLLGGAFGYGLSKSIKDSYLWLSQTYQPGDEVFVFGFSRGAYSARSLVGLMHKCGGVVNQPTQVLIDEAYDLYQDANSDATKFVAEHCQKARVRMIGVWETVGSLGVPVSGLPLALPGTRDYYRFHDTQLSCIVDEAYHALGIDEYREDFQPTLWDATTEKNKAVEQCWFIGDHGNVGGGDPNLPLWKLPYVWMQDKAIAAGLRMKTMTADAEWRLAPSDSFSKFMYGIYRIYKLNQRYIRKLGVNVEEVLHPSVLKRVQNFPQYRPKPFTNAGVPDKTTEIPRRHVVKPCSCCKEGGAATS
jgi:uncharacterized protein (DUF2235 family)